jgi:hypothetical protein
MSKQQRVSASLTITTRPLCAAPSICAAPSRTPSLQLSLPPATYLAARAEIHALGPGVISGKSTYAPVGRALLPSASLECHFGAWDVESQASLPSLKTHNIPSLLPTTHLGAHPLSPSPHPPPTSSNNCSWTSTPSTQLPRIQRSKGSSASRPVTSPSLLHPIGRVKPTTIREHQPWFCLPQRACTPPLLMLPSCRPTRAFSSSIEPC